MALFIYKPILHTSRIGKFKSKVRNAWTDPYNLLLEQSLPFFIYIKREGGNVCHRKCWGCFDKNYYIFIAPAPSTAQWARFVKHTEVRPQVLAAF